MLRPSCTNYLILAASALSAFRVAAFPVDEFAEQDRRLASRYTSLHRVELLDGFPIHVSRSSVNVVLTPHVSSHRTQGYQ